jgi:hypothetical protein
MTANIREKLMAEKQGNKILGEGAGDRLKLELF